VSFIAAATPTSAPRGQRVRVLRQSTDTKAMSGTFT
jgi:hypothetical protein